ncbi:FKBP-type peptidyl-prolyl cis-trans isomerase [Desulfobulbus alkaliphilus]|uniref:FKBP-type peptidyl-prolyl cis-trans isomerase n=1 Tax=Desulfobulbus alkaliphilus TaxID=869814 RepID=UPI00196433E1|nr:peptidylprolyl isomerase [Desulfobulbus alkaliphilus]MBM9537162.1 peptidylprolyl isomerase [Desulfobulbus alkaliphilus]
MNPVQLLDTVSISYTATLPSGEMVESVPEEQPITLTIGQGCILKAVEASLMGMKPGQSKTVHILPEDAYGPHHESLVHEVSLTSFGDRIEPKPGMILARTIEIDGVQRQVPVTVLAVDKTNVTLDYNHPLAGKTISYTVKLHAIAR